MDRRRFLALAAFFPATAFAEMPSNQTQLIFAARAQIGRTVTYDPSYVQLAFPGGDVPADRGVCTDVVIRAYREGLGLDLQKLVHDDMRKNFSLYPKRWGLKKPDRNIDHRRVPNLQTFFTRHGQELDVSGAEPGDLITMLLPGNLPHIGIVSDALNDRKVPLLIHNIGSGTQEEDVLGRYEIMGRYRFGLSA